MIEIKKFLYLLTKFQKRQLGILVFFLIIGIVFEMLSLGVLIPVLGLIFNPGIRENYPVLEPLFRPLNGLSQIQLALWGMGILVFVYLVKALFLIYLSWRQSYFSSHLSADLSRQLFYGYLCQPYSFHLQRNSAHLLRNIQGEIDQFTAVSQAAINLSIEMSAVIGVTAMLFIAEPIGALIVISFLLISALIFFSLIKNKVLEWGKKRLFHDSQITQHLMQGLGSVKDVKLMGREGYFLHKFDEHNSDKAKILSKQNTLLQVPRLYLELLAVIGLAGLVIFMLSRMQPMEKLIPTIGVFVAAAFRMIPSVNRIMGAIQSMRYSGPVVDRLYNEFKLVRNLQIKEMTKDQTTLKLSFVNQLEIKNLDFKYFESSQKALENISLSFNKGETIGFIGESGSGKSTLIDIILGLLAPDSGFVLVDNSNIDVNMKGWQAIIGYVPQTIFLTDDTIRRNIAFGISDPEIDNEVINRCLIAAQLDEFVNNLPFGLETNVGERGVKLSGGQRQRIGIARALYHNPQVLVLDEATSALDADTEFEVMKAVNALHGSKTILIVAHRLSTLQNCDKIFKINNGKLVDHRESKFLAPFLK